MKSKFIKWQLKEWSPILITLLFASALYLFSYYKTAYIGYHNSDTNPNQYFLSLTSFTPYIVVGVLYSTLLPLISLSYRYNSRRADIYYQLPLKKNELRNTRLLIGLIYMIVALAFLFFISMFCLYLNEQSLLFILSLKEIKVEPYHFIYIVPFFFLSLFFLCGNYFINACICSFANSWKNAVIYLFVFQFVLCTGLFFLSAIPNNFLYNSIYISNTFAIFLMSGCFEPSGIMPLIGLNYLFSGLLKDGTPLFISQYYEQLLIPSLICTGVFSILCAIYIFLAKEPSGEFSGKNTTRYKWDFYIPHFLALLLSFLHTLNYMDPRTSFFIGSIILTFTILGHYLLTCIIRGTFKLKKKDLICIGIISGINLIFSVCDIIFNNISLY